MEYRFVTVKQQRAVPDTNQTNLQIFAIFGPSSNYGRCIPKFSLLKPLYDCITKFEWNRVYDEVMLKWKLDSAPIQATTPSTYRLW